MSPQPLFDAESYLHPPPEEIFKPAIIESKLEALVKSIPADMRPQVD